MFYNIVIVSINLLSIGIVLIARYVEKRKAMK